MADLSKLRFNGTDYNVKDASAPKRKFDNTYAKTGNLPITSDDTIQSAIGKLENNMTPKNDLVDVYKKNGKTCNLVNFDVWANSVGLNTGNGKKTVGYNSITLAATGNDEVYTLYSTLGFPYDARISVTPGETLYITWDYSESTSNTSSAFYIFGNGDVSKLSYNNGNVGSLTYTVPSDVTFVTFRVGMGTNQNGRSVTYSNIQIITGDDKLKGFDDFMPYSLPNYAITPALIEQVDSGAKNLVNIADSTTTGSAYVFRNAPISLAAGSYVFSYISNQSSSGNIQMIIYNGSTDIFDVTVTSQAGRVAIPFTISSAATMITLYSVRAGTYSNFMICTLADWNASHKYVPPRLDWDNISNLVGDSLTPWPTIATGDNLNNIPITMASKGVYSMFAMGTSDALNAPTDGIFMVRTYRLATGTAVQEATMLTGNDRGKVYSRTFINDDSWSSWIQLTNV